MAFMPFPTSTPSSLEAMLASMQGGSADTMPMPVSDPGVAPLPRPSPMPGGAKPGPDFGGIAQKALPMILAFLANKKGGPLAGAGLLDGLTQGLARKRKAEQDAHELELQTINDETVRNERVAERQRTQQVQRANWLTNLQTQLAQIDDPVAFASTLDLADKVGASAFGFQPGELKSTFRFPKERETAAAASDANALLKKLKETHGDNLPALMQSNALVTFRGKQTPLRDVMAAAGVLASDDKGAPLLPSPPQPKASAITLGAFEDYVSRYAKDRGKKVEDLTSADLEDARKRYQQSDDRPRITVQTGQQGALPTAVQRRVDAKASAFDRQPIVKKIQLMAESVSFADALDVNTTNPADDQALIYAFAKAMDPESVVREGEYATVQKYAQSWAQQFGFNAARVFSNTHFLTPQARKQLKATIRQKYQSALPQYQNVRRGYASQINKITKAADGDDYLIDYAGGFPGVESGAPPPAASFSTVAPDGNTYTFPTQAALDAFKKKAGIK